MRPEDETDGEGEPHVDHDRSTPEPPADAQPTGSDAETLHKGSAVALEEVDPKQSQESPPPPDPVTRPRITQELLSDLDLSEPWISGDFLRESGVLIGGATALLYLTSQVYGAAYLSFFGVSIGFQGFGIGNLSMLSIPIVVILYMFTWLMYIFLSKNSLWAFLIGLAFTSGASCIRLFTTYEFTGTAHGTDWLVAALGPTSWISVCSWRGRAAKYMEKFAKSSKSLRSRLDLIPSSMLSADETRAMSRVIDYASRRAKQFRTRLWLLAGYITMLVAIPSIAWIFAIPAVQQEHQLPIVQGMPAHVPVYWVGDRSVYLTFDKGKCFVHVQIAGAEISRHDCPQSVLDVVN